MTLRFATFAGLMILISNSAYAQDAKTCSAIEDSLQRLTCFDKVFPRDATPAKPTEDAAQEPTTSPASAWQINEERSPLDDSVVYTAGLIPKDVSTSGIGDAQMFLLLRCSENTTSVVFTTSMFMVGETPTVTVRVGEGKAETKRWNRSTNYKAVGLWSGAEAIPFMKALQDQEQLAVRIQDNDRVDAVFDLAGVNEPIAKIRAYCKW